MAAADDTAWRILLALSVSHAINDTLQSLIPAVYPLIKASFQLNYAQVGLITLIFQLTASLLQPFVGLYADRRSHPNALATGMGFTLIGFVVLSMAGSFDLILVAVAVIGMGSSIFHPEASRLAKMASGGRHGLAQSIFQVGGNFGSSLGPLLAALVVARRGRSHILWFTLLAFSGILVLSKVGGWYRRRLAHAAVHGARPDPHRMRTLPRKRVAMAVAVLLLLIFSKFFYMASMSSYYMFYLIAKFHVPVQRAQVFLFVFLASVAAGTIVGGPFGDRFGRKYVIWISILGVAPFTLLLPHVGLGATVGLTVVIGFVLASAFSAILVYAQELIPGNVGLVAGLFFGFAFGMGGIGSALLGRLADRTSIEYVFQVCAFLPLIGMLTAFLPNLEGVKKRVVGTGAVLESQSTPPHETIPDEF
jgi:FSR family fosmidomycin resistance protein-like MFS transporter